MFSKRIHTGSGGIIEFKSRNYTNTAKVYPYRYVERTGSQATWARSQLHDKVRSEACGNPAMTLRGFSLWLRRLLQG